jgi:hypothetical protein
MTKKGNRTQAAEVPEQKETPPSYPSHCYVYKHLGKGVENAVTARTLSSRLNLSMRDISQQIEIERRAGVPICATSFGGKNGFGGYYLARTKADLEQYLCQLDKRIKEICITKAGCKRSLPSLPNSEFEQVKNDNNH